MILALEERVSLMIFYYLYNVAFLSFLLGLRFFNTINQGYPHCDDFKISVQHRRTK
jgi:hypothetical protein